MTQKYLKLNDVEPYKKSFALSNFLWEIIIQWNQFQQINFGGQFTRSVDSISANIAEGFGRYHKKDKIKFYRYARGSLYESLDWNEKANKRSLITEKQYTEIKKVLEELPRSINTLIKYTNQTLKE